MIPHPGWRSPGEIFNITIAGLLCFPDLPCLQEYWALQYSFYLSPDRTVVHERL